MKMSTKKVKLTVAIMLALTFTLALVIGIVAQQDEAEYVGSKKCRMCHNKEYKAWSKSPHATNFEVVKVVGKETEGECLKCHTTGYDASSGKYAEESAGCESCHGPGGKHAAKGLKKEERKALMSELKPGVCQECHWPHGGHPDLGADILPVLKEKLSKLQTQIAALEK
jgi:hypothetical protein